MTTYADPAPGGRSGDAERAQRTAEDLAARGVHGVVLSWIDTVGINTNPSNATFFKEKSGGITIKTREVPAALGILIEKCSSILPFCLPTCV